MTDSSEAKDGAGVDPASASAQTVPLAAFGHHPDPAIDFCAEVDAIEAEMTDLCAGLPATMDLAARIEAAMQFRVGGDCGAVVAKADLRRIENAFKAALIVARNSPSPSGPTPDEQGTAS